AAGSALGPRAGVAVGGGREAASAGARRRGAHAAGAGSDIGLALAGVALALSAALLLGTREGRAAARTGGARLAARLRPLVGRASPRGA
ncbi:MAG: hypothetical protein ACM3UV_04385, partial [Nocardioidaceae bacterium]